MRPRDDRKITAIAQATCQLVAERGLSTLTLADIARMAGIATSTLYVYYASKEALLSAVYAQTRAALFMRLLADDDPAMPYKARIRRMWTRMLENRLQHHAELAFQDQYDQSVYVNEAEREAGARFFKTFNAILTSGQHSEQIKPVPLTLIQAMTVGSVKEIANQIRNGALPDNDATAASGFCLFWDAIKV